MQNVYEATTSNKRKSLIGMIGFVAFVTAATYIMARAMGSYYGFQASGVGIVGIAFIISGITSIFSYYYSDRIVLSISSARPASRSKDFEFYTVSENLSIAAGIPKPKLYVIEDSATNAFATGRDPDHAVVVVTRGLLMKLNRTELEGVIAHELSHITNYDIRLMSIVTVLVGMVALIGDIFLRSSFRSRGGNKKGGAVILIIGLAFAILSPVIARLIKLSISRRREFYADASAVKLTRQPSGLISALTKISNDHEPLEVANKATAHLYIANPFKNPPGGGKTKSGVNWFSSLFNTHPPIKDRLNALKKMV